MKTMLGLVLGLTAIANAEFAVLDSGKVSLDLQYFGLTYHPGGGNDDPEHQYPRALDSAAYWVYQVGAQIDLNYTNRSLPYFGLQTTIAAFKDCIDVWSGHVHVGPRLQYRPDLGWGASIGLGPTLIWRENWWKRSDVVPWYNGDGFYGHQRNEDAVQTAFLWYGGNIDLSYMFTPKVGVIYSVIPGLPQVVSSAIGIRGVF